jgi:hypothetical protein
MYYVQAEENPTAHITVNKGRRKIKKDKFIYLNNGQEFEIELFNPTSDTVLCKIWINNKVISRSGIVLRPGERVFLERFIDDPSKFKFDTYEVNGSSGAVKKAIEKNGLVKVQFYREDTTPTYTPDITWTLDRNVYTYYNNTTAGTPINSTFTTNSASDYGAIDNTQTLGFSDDIVKASTASLKSSEPTRRRLKSKKTETGRVEKGSTSDQNFTRINKKFDYSPFHKVEYQIKPTSTMRMDAKQVINTTKYCTNCGKKGKYTHKFCSNCGNKL